jgi:hypothetical protein
MEEAPSEKPERTGNTVDSSVPAAAPYNRAAKKTTMLIPAMAKPTTLSPMTLPPANDIRSASPSPLLRAALAVRAFACVATLIPIKPERPEQTAPRAKATACSLRGPLFVRARRAATSTTKGSMTVYSRVRNAMAPSAT